MWYNPGRTALQMQGFLFYMSLNISPNHREILSAQSTITGRQEYLYSTNHALLITGTVTTSTSVPGSVRNGQLTVGTSAVQLPSNVITQGVTVEASINNTANVFVGNSLVTTSSTTGGCELPPGAAATIIISNTNLLYAISTSSSQLITFVGS